MLVLCNRPSGATLRGSMDEIDDDGDDDDTLLVVNIGKSSLVVWDGFIHVLFGGLM